MAVAVKPPLGKAAAAQKKSKHRAAQNSRLPLWAHTLHNENEPTPGAELKSLSHNGRVRFHTREFTPQNERKLVPMKTPNPELEEQLLYIALYRDKIADHQGNLDTQKSKDGYRGRSEQWQSRLPAAVLDNSFDGVKFSKSLYEADLASASDIFRDASNTAHDALTAGSSVQETSLPPLSRRFSVQGAREGVEQEQKQLANSIQTTTSATGAGSGGANEYLEFKRLGKLFDDWKTQQAELGEDTEKHFVQPRTNVLTSNGNGRHQSSVPRANGAESRASGATLEPLDDAAAGAAEHGSDTSEQLGARINESKVVSKIFQMITNPKSTKAAAADPKSIEGFPTLNLMRLYRGPWRLEC